MKRRQGGSALKASRKIANERFHGGMPKAVESEEIHFVEGLLRGPAFVSHAIGGDENAGAIVAKTAMEENFFFGIVAKESEEGGDLIVGGRRPSTDRNADETDAERFGLPALPGNFVGIFAAQIDDGSDPEIFEFLDAFSAWLRAAEKSVIDFPAVGQAVEFQSFAISRAQNGSSGCRRLGMSRCGNSSGKNDERRKKENCARETHIKLAAKSLARDRAANFSKWDVKMQEQHHKV